MQRSGAGCRGLPAALRFKRNRRQLSHTSRLSPPALSPPLGPWQRLGVLLQAAALLGLQAASVAVQPRVARPTSTKSAQASLRLASPAEAWPWPSCVLVVVSPLKAEASSPEA